MGTESNKKIVSWFIFGAGLVILLWLLFALTQLLQTYNWKPVSATVKSTNEYTIPAMFTYSRLFRVGWTGPDRHNSVAKSVIYSVDGKTYAAQLQSGIKYDAKNGDVLRLVYDPEHPSEVAIPNDYFIATSIVAIIFSLLAFGVSALVLRASP